MNPSGIRDWIYSPPLMFWIFAGLAVVWLVGVKLKEILWPILNSFINAIALSATNNALLFALALSLALSASSDTFAECFGPLMPEDMTKLGWWQVTGLLVKSFKPFFSTIAALLVNPPAIKAASSTAIELAKKNATPSIPPFPVANPPPVNQPPAP